MTQWIKSKNELMFVLAAAFIPFAPSGASAQVGIAGEVTSSYVWRGFEIDDAFQAQPDVWFDVGNLTFGAWSSWALNGDGSEIDLYVSLYKELPFGELNLSVTDYFYPQAEGDLSSFSNFNGGGDGAHMRELGAEFTPTAAPLTFMVAWNAYNDPDNAAYGQVGTDFSLGDFADVHGEAGLLLTDSENYYGGSAGDITHFGVFLSRGLSLGEVAPYISTGFVRSEIEDSNYWIFAIGF